MKFLESQSLYFIYLLRFMDAQVERKNQKFHIVRSFQIEIILNLVKKQALGSFVNLNGVGIHKNSCTSYLNKGFRASLIGGIYDKN